MCPCQPHALPAHASKPTLANTPPAPATLQRFCQPFVDSLLALPPAAATLVARDAGGSRALEALLEGAAPLEAKQKLLHLLAGHWGSVALSAPGSFLAEKAYSWADVGGKEEVVLGLLGKQKELEGSYWGPQVGVLLRCMCGLSGVAGETPSLACLGSYWGPLVGGSEAAVLPYYAAVVVVMLIPLLWVGLGSSCAAVECCCLPTGIPTALPLPAAAAAALWCRRVQA